MSQTPVPVEKLYQRCNPQDLTFTTTAELEELTETIGQDRALEAIDFGVGMQHEGYNLFVLGSTGIGKHDVVIRELKRRALDSDTPSDWCYVNNFDAPHKPNALELPAGKGKIFQKDMAQLVEDLGNAIPAAFRSDEYRTRVQEIDDEFTDQQEKAFDAVHEKAKAQGVAILRTPSGYTLAPMRDGKTLPTHEYDKLPKEQQETIEKAIEEIRNSLKETILLVPAWQKEYNQKLKQLDQEVTEITVDQLIGALIHEYEPLPEVQAYIISVKQDIIQNADDFRQNEEDQLGITFGIQNKTRGKDFSAYSVNLLVDNSSTKGSPVIYEDNPTYLNLVGRIEHISQLGTLLTDFTLIKPGALHKANGGYLVLDIRKVLSRAFAWEGLKRALRSHEIRIESLEHMLSLVSTISLEPEAIPVDVKLVLTGDRMLYYLLQEYDHEFDRLFKVAADFSEDFDRNRENTTLYAQLVASLVHRENLKEFSSQGVAAIIEECARRVGDSEKISLHMGRLVDLLRESDYWANKDNDDIVTDKHVHHAIAKDEFRQDQIRSRMQESIKRGIRMIDTVGEKVGQVNGLSVIHLNDFSFGIPSRITATARLGEGDVIDIEREVELGGPIHSKAVMILSAYLADHYAQNAPLSLSATLVFEQSYGYVEGDSASVAELCALLSAIAGIPLKQNFAITGSVNQLGQVQAIGGVNEKIEGFFDSCNERGLTGDQGVIIPASNLAHLMLRQRVLDAVNENKFNVYAVDSVEQVLGLITGLEVGERDSEGNYAEHTVNGRIQQRLDELNKLQQEFSAKAKGEASSEPA